MIDKATNASTMQQIDQFKRYESDQNIITAAKGGGILSTVKAVRESSFEDLVN